MFDKISKKTVKMAKKQQGQWLRLKTEHMARVWCNQKIIFLNGMGRVDKNVKRVYKGVSSHVTTQLSLVGSPLSFAARDTR